MKLCRACNQTKAVKSFYKHRETKDGLNSSCIECTKARSASRNTRLWQEKHALKQSHRNRKYTYEESGYRAKAANYKAHAKVRKLVWTLSLEGAVSLLQQDCHYCGAAPSRVFKYADWMRRRWPQYADDAMNVKWNGIDRINNDEGYIDGNVITCCWICNQAKRDMPYGEFIDWLTRVSEFRMKK